MHFIAFIRWYSANELIIIFGKKKFLSPFFSFSISISLPGYCKYVEFCIHSTDAHRLTSLYLPNISTFCRPLTSEQVNVPPSKRGQVEYLSHNIIVVRQIFDNFVVLRYILAIDIKALLISMDNGFIFSRRLILKSGRGELWFIASIYM